MKHISTLLFTIAIAVAAHAQDTRLQFTDSEGNIIAPGTALTLNDAHVDAFNPNKFTIYTGLYVLNTTDDAIVAGAEYTINNISNGAFQTCFPVNCEQQTSRGTYSTIPGEVAPGVRSDLQTEWFGEGPGAVNVDYRLAIYKYSVITKKYTVDTYGPSLQLNFSYDPSAIATVARSTIARVEYFNLSGQRTASPAHGVYIVRTYYTDGTLRSTKQLF